MNKKDIFAFPSALRIETKGAASDIMSDDKLKT